MNIRNMANQQWVAAGVLLLASMLPRAAGAQNTQKDDLFAGTEKFAQNASNVSEINMDPESLGLVNGDNAHRAHGLVLNVVRSYEYDKPGLYRMEDVDAFRKKLETGDWHCSVHTRDIKNGGSTDVCNRRRTDGMVETAIVTVEPRQLTFIHTIRRQSGDHSLDVPGVSGLLDGPGMTQLALIGPMLDGQLAQLGALAPEFTARMAALGPEMAARMAAMSARMAAQGARLQAMHPELQLHVQPPVVPKTPGQAVAPPALPKLAPPVAPGSPKQLE